MTKWSIDKTLSAGDTVSGIAVGPYGVACTSWDGSLNVTSGSKPLLQTNFNAPIVAMAWSETSPSLYMSLGNRKLVSVDPDQFVGGDLAITSDLVLGLSIVDQRSFAFVSRSSLTIMSSKGNLIASTNHGGIACDCWGTQVVTIEGRHTRVFDTRQLTTPVSVHEIPTRSKLLKVVWLNSSAFAVCDDASQVSVVYPNFPQDSYAFKSNRANIKLGLTTRDEPRPIYALTRGRGFDTTLATGGADGCVYVWDYRQMKQVSKASFPLPCMSVAYAQSGLIVGLSDDQWRTTPTKYESASKSQVMVQHIS